MKFVKLFSLSILHNYYKSGLCPDFIVEPTPETLVKLKNYRLQFKSKSNGCSIITGLNDDNSVFIEIPGTEKFSFNLVLQNLLFDNFTDSFDAGKVNLQKNIVPNGPWGNAEIACSDMMAKGKFTFEKDFQISFKATKTYWNYYIVTEDDISADKIVIEQNNLSGQNMSFNATKKISSAADSVTEKLLTQFPEKKLFMVKSNSKIDYSETIQKNIELKINGLVVIGHLPNPAINSKPNIIKYFKN